MRFRHGISMALVAGASLLLGTASMAKETITVAHLLDASHDAAFWAINNGKVTHPGWR